MEKYLRTHLLVTERNYWSMEHGECKVYSLNKPGIDTIREKLRIEREDVESVVIGEISSEFSESLTTGDFQYEEKSDRLWNSLQFFPSEVKRAILKKHGYLYNYDISCCAPTLLVYKAFNNGMGEVYTPLSILRYIEGKTHYRRTLSEEIGISQKQVKEIINALFCGARLGCNPNYALFQLVDCNTETMNKLRASEIIQDLRADIKQMWKYLEIDIPRKEVLTKKGNKKLERITSSMKWGLYFRLERKMLRVIEKYLKSTGCRYFLEHDGWATDQDIDIEFLSQKLFDELETLLVIEKDDLSYHVLDLDLEYDGIRFISEEDTALYAYFLGSENRIINQNNILVSIEER